MHSQKRLIALSAVVLLSASTLGFMGCKKKSSNDQTSSGGGASPAPQLVFPNQLSGDWNGTFSDGKILGMEIAGGNVTIVAMGVASSNSVNWNYYYGSWPISSEGNATFSAVVNGVAFTGHFTSPTQGSGTYGGSSWAVHLP